MDFEFAFKTLWGLATAGGWFWVNGIANRLKEAEAERAKLKEAVHKVQLEYQSKADARDLKTEVLGLLREIKSDLKEVNDKIDRKADKS